MISGGHSRDYNMQKHNTVIKPVVLIKKGDVVSPSEPSNREYWMDFREGLLRQLAALEKMLGISRRCRNCGSDVAKTG